jgi:hypothetical protein
MYRLLVALLAFVPLLGCERRASSPPQPPHTSQVVPSSASEDSVDASTGVETGCQFAKTFAHPEPGDLIGEFLRKDAAGAFLESNPWFDGATDCPGHEPGPDTYTMVAGYVTSPITTADTVVRVLVTYRALGEVHADATDSSVFDEHVRTVIDTLTVRRTPYGWRVQSPALWLRVLADSAFAEAKYRPFHSKDAERVRRRLAESKRGA